MNVYVDVDMCVGVDDDMYVCGNINVYVDVYVNGYDDVDMCVNVDVNMDEK